MLIKNLNSNNHLNVGLKERKKKKKKTKQRIVPTYYEAFENDLSSDLVSTFGNVK